MDNNYFLKEAHVLIDELYHEFEQYQNITNEILVMFHELCEMNAISYTLAFGSLLGAIRDGGHIPWDYDIDVIIPYYECEKLIFCLEEQLGQDYYYAYINNVENYPASCIRICKKGYSFTAIHVDVFLLVGCPSVPQKRKRFIKRINRISYLRSIKYSPDWFPRELGGGLLEKTVCFIDKLRAKLISKSKLNQEIKFMKSYPLGTTDHCLVAGDLRYKTYYRYEWFVGRKKVKVADKMLYVPANYKKILKKLYGDYLTYLPIRQRFNEFYNALDIIQKRNQNDNDIQLAIEKDRVL